LNEVNKHADNKINIKSTAPQWWNLYLCTPDHIHYNLL